MFVRLTAVELMMGPKAEIRNKEETLIALDVIERIHAYTIYPNLEGLCRVVFKGMGNGSVTVANTLDEIEKRIEEAREIHLKMDMDKSMSTGCLPSQLKTGPMG